MLDTLSHLVGKHVTFLSYEDGKYINGFVKSLFKDNGTYFYEVQIENRTTILPVRLYGVTSISVDPHIVGRAFKAQEDFYLPITQQKVKLDPSVTVTLYEQLADSCTDEQGMTDLPAMIAHLSKLTQIFLVDVKRDMGEDIYDEVVTLLQSMLPESTVEQENREIITQQVLEQRHDNEL